MVVMQPHEYARRAAAFTLIELLAVVLIILVLTGLMVGIAKYVNQRANISQTKALLARLGLGISNFRLDKGYYPTSTIYRSSTPLFHCERENSELLYAQLTGGPKKYVTFSSTEVAHAPGGTPYIVDPWGSPLVYFCPGSNVTYQVSNQTISYGYDTVPETNYCIAGLDNFTVGGLANSDFFDLFSYGPDKKTYVPGASQTWAFWNNPAWATDDVSVSPR